MSEKKETFYKLNLHEKRLLYKCKNDFVTLDQILTWNFEIPQSSNEEKYKPDSKLNSLISLYVGDITTLEIDCIVNAANSQLRGGGGVDGAIHEAAGADLLQAECRLLNGCSTGQAKMTSGYKLPARYICHAVGPIGENKEMLANAYRSSLDLVKQHKLRSVAFPCISTGVYGYPNLAAAHVAIQTCRDWLEQNSKEIDRLIFCVFLSKDYEIYKELLHLYFPNHE